MKTIIKSKIAIIVIYESQLWYTKKHNNILNKLGIGCAKLRAKFAS